MKDRAYDPLKRLIDIGASLFGLIALAPVGFVLAGLVRLKLGSPVLFRQLRPGKDEHCFELVKFRSMVEPDEAAGLVSDAERLTPFGAFLRSTSLDELPALWNVLRGDMSLVGPRPLLVQYLDLYNSRQRRRHEVRPGITGLAQTSGRNALSWPDRLELDVRYVDQRSLVLDLRILLTTIKKVLWRDGISDGVTVTMSEFRGTGSPE